MTEPSGGFLCSAWENTVRVGEMLPWGSLAYVSDLMSPVTHTSEVRQCPAGTGNETPQPLPSRTWDVHTPCHTFKVLCGVGGREGKCPMMACLPPEFLEPTSERLSEQMIPRAWRGESGYTGVLAGRTVKDLTLLALCWVVVGGRSVSQPAALTVSLGNPEKCSPGSGPRWGVTLETSKP